MWQGVAFLLATSLVLCTAGRLVPAPQGEVCPKRCSCDMVEDRKRADCSNERLISTHTDVPTGVEILDLSINLISSIEDDSLAHYGNLVKLFLSENSIETIALDAFSRLPNLATLDLSHNRLERLDEQLFERNTELSELNLSNNNFMMLSDQPFLRSPSLAILHLSECHIPHVFDAMFTHLPNLQSLDVSRNVMNGISIAPFTHLRKLSSIDLNDNRWDCGSQSVRTTVRWMKKRIARIQVESCLLTDRNVSGSKFERMMEDPSLDDHHREEVAIEDVWGNGTRTKAANNGSLPWPAFMNVECSYNNHGASKEPCNRFVECQQSYGELFHSYRDLVSRHQRPFGGRYSRLEVFLSGGIVGMLIGAFGTYIIYWAIRSCRKRHARRQEHTVTTEEQKQFHQELRREFQARNRFAHSRLTESPVTRSRVPRGSATVSDEEIYQNHEHTRQFLVNLFSKRQPRYVRNNSQIANINNRHMPPRAPIGGLAPHQPSELSPAQVFTHDDVTWYECVNAENYERERTLVERDALMGTSEELLLQPTWVSIRPTVASPGGTLPRNYRPHDIQTVPAGGKPTAAIRRICTEHRTKHRAHRYALARLKGYFLVCYVRSERL
ncbi:uncharacterized protein LOC131208200 [Anopheles bellator]|uniref:uncharacterized protein LOC131208200 n=1 Tax=Anopheles bellator TaxID=139047 RepID=UPI002649D918|nr:uncharacterized protein LOC131208200 [Anopheles bellator]